jgi:hypothetical protein
VKFLPIEGIRNNDPTRSSRYALPPSIATGWKNLSVPIPAQIILLWSHINDEIVILDRLVHNAHRVEMRGDSMRKNRGKQPNASPLASSEAQDADN